MDDVEIGPKIIHLLNIHDRTSKLSQKAQARLLEVDPSTLTRWKQGTLPETGAQGRAAYVLGISPSDLTKPIEELEEIIRVIGASAWEKAEWQISCRFAERWRHNRSAMLDILKGTHLMYLRIPRTNSEELIASSMITFSEVLENGKIKFALVNIDDSSQDSDSQIFYRYDGLAFPVSDTIFLIGERIDGSEPISLVLDFPSFRGPLSGFVVAVGVAPGRHYPMARRVVLVPKSSKTLPVSDLRSELGIFSVSDAPYLARENTKDFN